MKILLKWRKNAKKFDQETKEERGGERVVRFEKGDTVDKGYGQQRIRLFLLQKVTEGRRTRRENLGIRRRR